MQLPHASYLFEKSYRNSRASMKPCAEASVRCPHHDVLIGTAELPRSGGFWQQTAHVVVRAILLFVKLCRMEAHRSATHSSWKSLWLSLTIHMKIMFKTVHEAGLLKLFQAGIHISPGNSRLFHGFRRPMKGGHDVHGYKNYHVTPASTCPTRLDHVNCDAPHFHKPGLLTFCMMPTLPTRPLEQISESVPAGSYDYAALVNATE